MLISNRLVVDSLNLFYILHYSGVPLPLMGHSQQVVLLTLVAYCLVSMNDTPVVPGRLTIRS